MTPTARMCFGKKYYHTLVSAQHVARMRMNDKDHPAPPLRAYKCPHCLRFHLTKQTKLVAS
jgi:hypothetical protein